MKFNTPNFKTLSAAIFTVVFTIGSLLVFADKTYLQEKQELKSELQKDNEELSAMNAAHRVKRAKLQEEISELDAKIDSNSAKFDNNSGKIELLDQQINAEMQLQGLAMEK